MPSSAVLRERGPAAKDKGCERRKSCAQLLKPFECGKGDRRLTATNPCFIAQFFGAPMPLDAANEELLVQHAAHIAQPEVRAAFAYLVGCAALNQELFGQAHMKGHIRDFRLKQASGAQPFSFIVNRESLLFYFRLPAVQSGRYRLVELQQYFDEVRENDSGEWTVRVADLDGAKRLWDYADSAGSFRSGDGSTTRIGYVNANNQLCKGHRGVPGNDHSQWAYRMDCLNEGCGAIYGANGSDVFQRRCPRCQGGKPGISF